MAAVIRLKRKACDEPAEALLIALKKSKVGTDAVNNEVYFKLAATVSSETDSVHNHIQAAIAKDKLQRAEWGKNPKAVRHRPPYQQRMRALHLAESQRKRHDLHNYIRLILAQSSPQKEQDSKCVTEGAAEEELKEMKNLYKLYDIIEETEDIKSKPTESQSESMSEITCNGVPFLRTVTRGEEKTDSVDYVYDVYVADEGFDERFTYGAVCVKPCDLNDLVFPEDEQENEPEERYDDEDDSNDEDNWRNDYPDQDPELEDGECSDFEKEYDYCKDYEYGNFNDSDDFKLLDQFKEFGIDENKDGYAYAEYKVRTLKALKDEEEYSD